MKNLFKIASFVLLAIFATGCDDADNTIDQVFDDVENGAVLRTVSTIFNEVKIPLVDNPDDRFEILIEMQDVEDGDLLERVEVYNSYTDVSEGTTTSDVLANTITASEFSDGPFGLPRYTLLLTNDELLALHGLGSDDIFGGDYFTTNLVLYLTDGRIFDVNNAGGIITGGFFASPFQYRTNVGCGINGLFEGDYFMEQLSGGNFGRVFDDQVVTFTTGANSLQRVFEAVYLPQFAIGNGPRPFATDIVCGEFFPLSGQASGLQCSAGITFGPADASLSSTFDPFNVDDSVFEIAFTEDESADCGGTSTPVFRFTKQ